MSENPIFKDIKEVVDGNEIVLFMKGTPVFPQCGFSSTTVKILTYLGVQFRAINVLDNEDVRHGIKEFSDWPTIPQLYVKGEFVGGCDSIQEMFENGELRDFFSEKGIETAGLILSPPSTFRFSQ